MTSISSASSRRTAPSRRAQRGVTLLESLIAFVLLATGALAVASLQGQLRLHADLARQRSEAVRLGQQEIEQPRAFSVLPAAAAGPGAHAYASIVDDERVVDRAAGFDSNTSYRVVRRIDHALLAGAKGVSVSVAWSDRAGGAQRVVLDTIVVGEDPAWSGALALGAGIGLPLAASGAHR